MSKICTHLFGGLGNQLFIYSHAFAIAEKTGARLYCDTKSGFKRDPFDREPIVRNLGGEFSDWHSPVGFRMMRIVSKIGPLCGIVNKLGWVGIEPQLISGKSMYSEMLGIPICEIKNSLYLFGYWQNENYFRFVEHKLKAQMLAGLSVKASSSKIEQTQLVGTSICIHVRRTHGIGAHGKSVGDQNKYKKLPIEYYHEAINVIRKRVRIATIYVFADCFDWIKANLKTDIKVVYVDSTPGVDNTLVDFNLMRACSHFVVANSTYSWWAAWLSLNQDKIVIAPNPKRYFGGGVPAANWLVLD